MVRTQEGECAAFENSVEKIAERPIELSVTLKEMKYSKRENQ